jgi:LemA protein
MSRGIVFGGLALVAGGALLLGLVLMGQYNGLVTAQQAVDASWAQVENVYQRRADLIPNLVATVKGSASFEQETLEKVVAARSQVGQLAVGKDVLADPQAFQRFQASQGELSSALSRLMVVVEQYPDLQSTAAFRDLMSQLEGSENRIAVERKRFNEVAQDYNSRLQKVPTVWFVSLLGWSFAEKPYFAAQAGAAEAPKVAF